jgi:hypothetical protein
MSETNIIDIEEVIQLAAIDGVYFSQEFFPKTVRQASPKFHYDIWDLIENPVNRLCSLQIFRDGAKTSILRLLTAKRIAYATSRTILYIGKSEGHAVRSIQWIRRAILYNHRYAQVFNLRKGNKWGGTETEIFHGVEDFPITILAAGIEGAVRGINVDDYRPDLIVLDDVIGDANAATSEQREKLADLITGAVKDSLAPASECPNATIAMLNTPINRDDASCRTEHDPEWSFLRIGCWTPETANLAIDHRESSWPERYPSEVFRDEKKKAIQRNKASIFAREKECVLISAETCDFKPTWLSHWSELPEYGNTILVIDPVPKASEVQIKRDLHGKDYECHMVLKRYKHMFFCCEYKVKRGHDPSWSIATMFALAHQWKVRKVIVETVAYQSTLAWLFEQEMKRRGVYYQIQEFTDRRSKRDRIVDGLNGPASQGEVYVHQNMTELITQFNDYPTVDHDDILECLAIGVADLSTGAIYDGEYESIEDDEDSIPALENYRASP